MPSDDCTMYRHALENRTNNPETPTHRHKPEGISSFLPTPPTTGSRVNRAEKRRAGEDGTGALQRRVKMAKVDYDPFLDDVDSDSSSSAYESDSDDNVGLTLVRAQRQPRADASFLCTRMTLLMNPLSAFNPPPCMSIHNSCSERY